MIVDVTKSYLDLARSVIETQIRAKDGASIDDAIFALMSCTYVYSYSALLSFCSVQLHILWLKEGSELRAKYPNAKSFEQLMASTLKDVKAAFNELVLQKGLDPIHVVEPQLWQHLNEFVKNYRDFFLHPNPALFNEYIDKVGSTQWKLPSSAVAGLLAYVFKGCIGSVPGWVHHAGLKSIGFEVENI